MDLRLQHILIELGLEADRAEILYKTKIELTILTGITELERMKYLQQQSLLLLLGGEAVGEIVHQV